MEGLETRVGVITGEGDKVNEILKVVLVGIFTTIVAVINKSGEI